MGLCVARISPTAKSELRGEPEGQKHHLISIAFLERSPVSTSSARTRFPDLASMVGFMDTVIHIAIQSSFPISRFAVASVNPVKLIADLPAG